MTILPPNSKDLELALEKVMDPDLSPEIIRSLWNPWTCPIDLLPWLAWAMSVDDWDNTWDEQTQRRVVAASIGIHQRKGTVGAVRRAMASLGHNAKLVEWWQTTPPGLPHTFTAEVAIDSRGFTEGQLSSLERQIDRVKPVRSHYGVHLVAETRLDLRVGCLVLSGEAIEIRPLQLTDLQIEPAYVQAAVGGQDWATVTIYPKTSP